MKFARSTQEFRDWDQAPNKELNEDEIVKMYERGFAGAGFSQEDEDELLAMCKYANAQKICDDFGYADSAKGELVKTWTEVEKAYPGCWPAKAQRRGSCVAHSNRNAEITTLVGEVVAGLPDPVSGKLFELPKVSPVAQADGVLAIEPKYRYRGHRSDGWWCSSAVKVSIEHCGAVLRKNYPGIADLTTLDSKWAGAKWNASQISAEEKDTFDDNLFRDGTKVDSFEELRDLLARGFGITSCGSEGFSGSRDENGVMRRRGSWAHAMCYCGCDDRPEIHRRYGGPLVLVLNSWGSRWGSGSRKVMGTNLEIPHGSFWAKWSDLSRRSAYALSGLNGWERKKIDWTLW